MRTMRAVWLVACFVWVGAAAASEDIEAAVPEPPPADEPAATGSAAATPDAALHALYERARPAVVRILAGDSFGTGFAIDDGAVIATAWHVVRGDGTPFVEDVSGERLPARLLAFDRDADVALLSLEAPLADAAPLRLRGSVPVVGETLYAVGHPLLSVDRPRGQHEGLLAWSLTAGRVSVVGEHQLQTTVLVHPGNSGGPVFDGDGEVVGVAVERIGGFGLVRKIDAVAALLAAHAAGELPARPPHISGYLAPRAGMLWRPGQSEGRVAYGGAGVEIGLEIDRRLWIALRAQMHWLTSSAERDAGRPGRVGEAALAIGPSLVLARKRPAPVHVALQPHLLVGFATVSTGTRERTLEWLDPSCDPAAGPCPFQETDQTTWDRRNRMLLGAGLRVDVARAFLDVGVTFDPSSPGGSVGVGLGFGIRLGP